MLISFSFRYPFIISRIAAFCGLSFLLAIIIPPDCVVLSYISLQVYTNFGIVPIKGIMVNFWGTLVSDVLLLLVDDNVL